ncbi:MAG: hypothetical protein ABJA87_04780 [bacterium]
MTSAGLDSDGVCGDGGDYAGRYPDRGYTGLQNPDRGSRTSTRRRIIGTGRRALQLLLGLMIYGLSMSLMVQAHLGLDSWDVLHQGLSRHTGRSMGTITIIVGVVVLLGWIPLRERPGVGTVSNALVVGLAFDFFLPLVSRPHELWLQVLCLAAGIGLCGLATGLYLTVGWGSGPRDGLMTGIARRTGWSLRLTRTGLEIIVLVTGAVLGGSVGIGTVAFALLIGPASQFFISVLGGIPHRAGRTAGSAQPEESVPVTAAT